MANALYDLGREAFLKGEISWSGDNIKAVLVDLGEYTPDLETDQYLSDVPSDARVATSGNLSGKTTSGGVADADNVTFTSVTGDSCEAIVLYQDTGNPATSRLIAYLDTATGLPITPNGSNILVTWPSSANKIFKL